MTQGKTTLVDSCQYLVRRPNEIFLKAGELAPDTEDQSALELSQEELLQQTVYIQHRLIKDPRDIKMLDPACGSMHFGLYAFDLFEHIYTEAWDIEADKGSEVFFNEEGVVPKDALHEAYSSKENFLNSSFGFGCSLVHFSTKVASLLSGDSFSLTLTDDLLY